MYNYIVKLRQIRKVEKGFLGGDEDGNTGICKK